MRRDFYDHTYEPALNRIESFVAEVGFDGQVAAIGGGTHDEVGGLLDRDTRRVSSPAISIAHDPAELIVRCDAGVTVAELDAELALAGQMVPLDPGDPDRQTVGGVLSVGWSGHRRLGYGHLRDLLLGMTYVSAGGRLVQAGGSTVKNVAGYDLCRLFVGSLGTLGLIGDVVLRCLPLPDSSSWFISNQHPLKLFEHLYRPTSVMWDGQRTWVLLEGESVDIATQAAAQNLVEAAAPNFEGVSRSSIAMRDLSSLTGDFLVEIGTGTVHHGEVFRTTISTENQELQRTLKQRFDPTGRLAPGREPWGRR